MRAITLTQPWAGLVASGIKLVENRPRTMIKREDFGKRFAIHASRELDEDVYARIHAIAPELVPYGQTKAEWARLSRITSAVIGVAVIDGVHVDDTDDYGRHTIAAILGDQARWFFGPIGYVLRDVVALQTPVTCRGWQGFWTLHGDVERQVMEQLG